jgi:hypothetical protein
LIDHHELFALRYATMTGRRPHQNYLIADEHSEGADLDFYVWLIRGKGGDIWLILDSMKRQPVQEDGRLR